MTPRAMRAQARVLGAALLLAIASSDTRAADLYRWVTQDGRVEIGATPPPGTAAVPWNPGQEAVAHPTAPPAEPPAPAPAVTPPAAANGRARSRLDGACLTEKATQKIRILENQIARLERRLEDLEATELAYSETSCRSQGIEGPSSDCLTSSFHRDAEISRTQAEIEEAQQKLGDLEQRARSIPARAECAPASAE